MQNISTDNVIAEGFPQEEAGSLEKFLSVPLVYYHMRNILIACICQISPGTCARPFPGSVHTWAYPPHAGRICLLDSVVGRSSDTRVDERACTLWRVSVRPCSLRRSGISSERHCARVAEGVHLAATKCWRAWCLIRAGPSHHA